MLVAQRWVTPCNLHPLYIYVLAYMFGIWAQIHEHAPTTTVMCGIAGFICLWLITPSPFFKLAMFSILFCGGGAYRSEHSIKPYKSLFSHKEFEQVQCSGTVCDIYPYRHPYFKQRITITTDALCSQQDPKLVHKLQGYIYVFAPETEPFTIGDTLIIDNLKLRQPKTQNDLLRRAKDKTIGSLFQKKGSWLHKKALDVSWQQSVFDAKTRITRAVCSSMNAATTSLYASLFLGNKALMPLDTSTISGFSLWGISHHLARSGLHLIIVIWLWSFYLQRIPIFHTVRHILLIALGSLYYVFSWPTLSFNRACLSFLLYQVCAWHKNKLDPLQTIAWTTLCFLIVSPVDLFSLDFQLSFGLTHAIGWFNHLHSRLHTTSQ